VEGITIDVGTILHEFDALKAQADCVVVEGAGGWLVPIGNGLSMADVAVALALPVVMVVGLRLGCLNHAALTAQAITASGLRLVHWIANEIDPAFARREENIATLAGLLGEPLAVLPYVRDKKAPELSPEAGRRLAETL
jgi:dethiobiotin synthetase